MGVLGRMNDIIRSNLNGLLTRAENPEKLLKQAILDMEDHVRKARQQLLDTIAAEKALEKKRRGIVEESSRWERRAELALREGDDELAKQALLRKGQLEDQAEHTEGQIKIQREYVGALKQSMLSLEERMREARARKDGLIARAQVAKAKRKSTRDSTPQQVGGGLEDARAFETFERMEDKVNEIEAKVEAFQEVADPAGLPIEDPGLDARFETMEKGQDIEEKLERLRKQIKGSGKRVQKP